MEPRPLSPEAIRRELERVLDSGGFARNERLSQFLRFIVETHLDGRNGELKESVLAVEVFGRKAGYDPKLDAVVRTEAMRLRVRLDKYYQGDGFDDPVIIELPKGGYRPTFRERTPIAQDTNTADGPPRTLLDIGGGLRARPFSSSSQRAAPGGGPAQPGPL